MLKRTLITVLFLISIKGVSQIQVNDTLVSNLIIPLKGQVISNVDKKPLKGAHLFNLNSVIGTVTNDEGVFEIKTKVQDTIYVSYIGYQSIKLKITNDLLVFFSALT